MPLLQVRDFPEDLYRALEARAKEERRSISQQTIVLLDNELGSDSSNKARRKKILNELESFHDAHPHITSNLPSAAELIREDRER